MKDKKRMGKIRGFVNLESWRKMQKLIGSALESVRSGHLKLREKLHYKAKNQ